MSSLQQARDWSHEATKNFLNANKMIDIVNDVIRCSYAMIDVYTKLSNCVIKKLLSKTSHMTRLYSGAAT